MRAAYILQWALQWQPQPTGAAAPELPRPQLRPSQRGCTAAGAFPGLATAALCRPAAFDPSA